MRKLRTHWLTWPAFVTAVGLASCAAPGSAPLPPAQAPETERYRAIGQEPGWLLDIRDNRIDYNGSYGDVRISVPRPDPRPTFNGRRYETQRLTVDITYSRCNDVMSGHGYEHQVMVTADGQTFRGCGGARRTDWDN